MLDNDMVNCTVIVNSLSEWVTAVDTTLTVQGTELTTNIKCPVIIVGFDDNYCDVTTNSAAKVAKVAAPTVVVGTVIIVVLVAIFIHLRRRKKSTYELLRYS